MSPRVGQPVKFVLVGVGGFALNLLVFTALFGVGLRYLAASLLAFAASNAAMYLGNRYFTFGLGHEGLLPAYLRYAVVGGIVAALTAVLLAAFVEGLGLDPRVGQALALNVLVPVAFRLSKRFAFRLEPA